MSQDLAVSTPAPETTPDHSAERYAMLEMDLPVESTPALPSWAVTAVAAIRAIVVGLTIASAEAAFTALAGIVGPLRAYPDGHAKAACRTAKDAKLAEIEAVRRAPAATVRQVIPTVTTAPIPMVAAAPTRPVLRARWALIPAGPGVAPEHAGQWGASMLGGYGAPQIGDAVDVCRNKGNGAPTRKYLAARYTTNRGIVFGLSDTRNTTDTASIEAAPVAPITPALGNADAHHAAILATVPEMGVPVDSGTTLAGDLAAISEEASHNAASGTIGSMAGGQLRGVGFSTAEGYITAIRRGVTAATHESYLATLRGQYGYSAASIEALALPGPQLGMTSDLPVGPGITHTPTGPTYADMTPTQRRALRKVGQETRATVRKLITESDLIAGAVAAGSMLQVSWMGGGTTTLAKVREALAAIGREHDAPKAPSAERHAGRAVDSLRNRDLDTARLPTRDLPDGVKARWLVGRKLTGASVTAGAAYGEALLIVSLRDDDSLTFEGATDLGIACEAHYRATTGAEQLRSEDLTAWFGRVLHGDHYAVKRGPVWYVPGGEADNARALSEALSTLWGDHERIPVTTGADLMRSLTRGLSDELASLTKEYNTATDTAKERAKVQTFTASMERLKRMRTSDEAATVAATAEADLAERRACISPVVGARLLCDLAKISAKVDGYSAVLGDDSVASIKVTIRTLRDAIEPTCTDGDQRAAILELT